MMQSSTEEEEWQSRTVKRLYFAYVMRDYEMVKTLCSQMPLEVLDGVEARLGGLYERVQMLLIERRSKEWEDD